MPNSQVCQSTSHYNKKNCLPTDAKGELALRTLPTMLPPTVYKVVVKGLWLRVQVGLH